MKKVLALGFFDSVHIGHQDLIAKVASLAAIHNARPVVLTFDDNFFPTLKRDTKEVFTLRERIYILNNMGMSDIIVINSKSLSLSGMEFLEKYLDKDVVAVVSGEDYTFGHGAKLGIKELNAYCKEKNIIYEIVPMHMLNGNKVASTDIRSYLLSGDIGNVNKLLGREYIVIGMVTRGRGMGGKFGFPTANIYADSIKLLPRTGVYKTNTLIDGKLYKSVTNIGSQPTFDSYLSATETMVIGFDGNLYDKEIIVSFIKRLRDVIKFGSVEQLKKQIDKDIKEAIND